MVNALKFESPSGLYYYDATYELSRPRAYTFLHSVEANRSIYTRRQLAGADKAKRLYELVGWPSAATFIKMVQTNQLKNCPVTVEVAKRAARIYGPNIAALRGKTTRRAIKHVPSDLKIELPPEILTAYKKVTLCVDIFLSTAMHFSVQFHEAFVSSHPDT